MVHELMAEAADLRHGWQGYNPDAKPGKAHLPIVDEVINATVDRANVLRRDWLPGFTWPMYRQASTIRWNQRYALSTIMLRCAAQETLVHAGLVKSE